MIKYRNNKNVPTILLGGASVPSSAMHKAAAAAQKTEKATATTPIPKIMMIIEAVSGAFALGCPLKMLPITTMPAPTADNFSKNSKRFLNLVAGSKMVEMNRTACQLHTY